jgi:hypothetical protein
VDKYERAGYADLLEDCANTLRCSARCSSCATKYNFERKDNCVFCGGTGYTMLVQETLTRISKALKRICELQKDGTVKAEEVNANRGT